VNAGAVEFGSIVVVLDSAFVVAATINVKRASSPVAFD
jgi:hypothetical protein